MDSQYKHYSHLTIAEAVETLSEIAELDLNHEEDVSWDEDFVETEGIPSERTHRFLQKEDGCGRIRSIRETFRVVLDYLHHYYGTQVSASIEEKHVENIKTVMLLVGEAAKKLDKYTQLFHLHNSPSVVELSEYKKFQEFYHDRVAVKIDEEQLGKWIFGISQRLDEPRLEPVQNFSPKVFIDLDSVKKDSEYELFFLKKEDGTRFFNPRLLRNMKLADDFGVYIGTQGYQDPLSFLDEWRDGYFQSIAMAILQDVGLEREFFFRQSYRHIDHELVKHVGNCFMALKLSASPQNSVKHDGSKAASDYFRDFQMFLRIALRSREYLRLVAYPPKETNKMGRSLLALLHHLCRAVYCAGNGFFHTSSFCQEILELSLEGEQPGVALSKRLSERLVQEYRSVGRALRVHPDKQLSKLLDNIEQGTCNAFDPLAQHLVQCRLFSMKCGERQIANLCMGSPTIQEYVHKASVNDEFKGFLYGCLDGLSPRHTLLLDLQDRTSWKEESRCVALEELQQHADFGKVLTVVTIPRDSDFYHQLNPYDQNNQAEAFLSHLSSAFDQKDSYFPSYLRTSINKAFFKEVAKGIHQVFFSGKNVLLPENRRNFIEIFDLLLLLKMVETSRCEAFSVISKDGVDVASTFNCLLYCFMKLINDPQGLSEADWEQLNLIIYSPAFLIRERVVSPDRFDRMISALKAIEAARDEFGAGRFIDVFHSTFGIFFKTPILKSSISME